MQDKSDYLIWREKDGFFTALDKGGSLVTWSLMTGKLLYIEHQKADACDQKIADYEVYRADKNDITYTQGFYNQVHSSVQLLKTAEPVRKDVFEEAVSRKSCAPSSHELRKSFVSQNDQIRITNDNQGTD